MDRLGDGSHALSALGIPMLNRIAKALLVATSLAPVLFGYGVVALGDNQSWNAAYPWFVAGIGLGFVAYLMPRLVLKLVQPQPMPLKSVKDADKEILTFLITYLLPFAGRTTLNANPYSLAGVYVFSLIFLAVYHTNAFTFNPLLAVFGYHFYEVETQAGMKYLLVTKSVIRQQDFRPWVVPLSDYVYLESKDPNL